MKYAGEPVRNNSSSDENWFFEEDEKLGAPRFLPPALFELHFHGDLKEESLEVSKD